MPRLLGFQPSSRRQAPVESESFQEVCDLVPDAKGGILSEECDEVKGSRGAGARSCANSWPARWQSGGQGYPRRKRTIAGAEFRTCGFWMSTPLFAHADRSFDVTRWRAGRLALGAKSWGNPRCTSDVSNRGWDVPQVCVA